MSGASISVRDFVMRFGDRDVVDGLSFDVAPGETFGLLGSNGSGKTTTIRALLGITTPTAGSLTIDGAVASATCPRNAACTARSPSST